MTTAAFSQVAPAPDYVYDRQEEIIHNQKRYRLHNNYLTFGAGYLSSSLRAQSQKQVGADFQFHIRREHFQAGVMMSGPEYLSNNDIQLHLGYGKRYESGQYNIAVFAGPAYNYGVKTITDSTGIKPELYEGFGAYICAQAVVKLTYDIGIGAELSGTLSSVQNMFGFRIILFFSGAYRGPKKNYNPHVRSENPR